MGCSNSHLILCTLSVCGFTCHHYFSEVILGYAGYYGLSLISGSYAVLFVSLAAHAAQFAFLIFFENPRK